VKKSKITGKINEKTSKEPIVEKNMQKKLIKIENKQKNHIFTLPS